MVRRVVVIFFCTSFKFYLSLYAAESPSFIKKLSFGRIYKKRLEVEEQQDKIKKLVVLDSNTINAIISDLKNENFLIVLSAFSRESMMNSFSSPKSKSARNKNRKSLEFFQESNHDMIQRTNNVVDFPEQPPFDPKKLNVNLAKIIFYYSKRIASASIIKEVQDRSVELILSHVQYLLLKCFFDKKHNIIENNYKLFFYYIDFLDWYIKSFAEEKKTVKYYLESLFVNQNSQGLAHNGRLFYNIFKEMECCYIPERGIIRSITEVLSNAKNFDRKITNVQRRKDSESLLAIKLHSSNVLTDIEKDDAINSQDSDHLRALASVEQLRRDASSELRVGNLTGESIEKAIKILLESFQHTRTYDFEVFARHYKEFERSSKLTYRSLVFIKILNSQEGDIFYNKILNTDLNFLKLFSFDPELQSIIDDFFIAMIKKYARNNLTMDQGQTRKIPGLFNKESIITIYFKQRFISLTSNKLHMNGPFVEIVRESNEYKCDNDLLFFTNFYDLLENKKLSINEIKSRISVDKDFCIDMPQIMEKIDNYFLHKDVDYLVDNILKTFIYLRPDSKHWLRIINDSVLYKSKCNEFDRRFALCCMLNFIVHHLITYDIKEQEIQLQFIREAFEHLTKTILDGTCKNALVLNILMDSERSL